MKKKVRFSNKVMIKYFKKSDPISEVSNIETKTNKMFYYMNIFTTWRSIGILLGIFILYKFLKRIR